MLSSSSRKDFAWRFNAGFWQWYGFVAIARTLIDPRGYEVQPMAKSRDDHLNSTAKIPDFQF